MDITAAVACLSVTDAARSIDFYTARLGFQLAQVSREEGRTMRAVLRHGEATLLIGYGAPPPPGTDSVALYLFVPSARHAHAELASSGMDIGEVSITAYSMEEFRVCDPDGHVIAIGSPAVQLA